MTLWRSTCWQAPWQESLSTLSCILWILSRCVNVSSCDAVRGEKLTGARRNFTGSPPLILFRVDRLACKFCRLHQQQFTATCQTPLLGFHRLKVLVDYGVEWLPSFGEQDPLMLSTLGRTSSRKRWQEEMQVAIHSRQQVSYSGLFEYVLMLIDDPPCI